MPKQIKIKPIGYVIGKVKKQKFGGWEKLVTKIVVDEKFTDALDGLEDFSHIIVLYWMDKVNSHVIKHRPQGTGPLVGIFSCRCPARPNPIGITTAKLLKREKNVLTVKGLDVLDKTPVIDIKPYAPRYDAVKNPKIPKWINELEY